MSEVTDKSQLSADARQRVLAARIIAEHRWPYLSSMLYALRIVESRSEDLETMAVDSGWRMYYNPSFVMELTPGALATVVLHECMHCLLKHHERFQAVTPQHHQLWNFAGDASINETLDGERMEWPEISPPIRFSTFSMYGLKPGMTTESAYFKLVAAVEKLPTGATGAGDTGVSIRGESDHDCGSVIDNKPRRYELPTENDKAPAAKPEEQDQVRDKTAQAVNEAHKNGDIPAGLEIWAKEYLEPTIDWRRQLSIQIRRAVSLVAGRRDYSYSRPSRRQEAMRLSGSTVLMPAMRQPAPPRIAVVVDTSGSISDEDIRSFIGEVSGMARAVGLSTGLTIIPTDYEAYRPIQIKRISDLDEIELEGGGGTHMPHGIDAAMALRPKPHIIITLTDGYTNWHTEQPRGDFYYIAVSTVESTLEDIPEWMHQIYLNPDADA